MSGVTTPAVDLAASAVEYASRGVKVFPLWWPTGDHSCACTDGDDCGSPGKHPRLGRGGVNRASADVDEVRAWWQRWPFANVGLPAGDNGLAVLDVDPRHGGDDALATLIGHCAEHGCDLMATRIVRTGSGGLHLMFRAPRGGIKTAARTFGLAGIDTRGRGGYVVAPPSVHASGGRYELMSTGHGLAPWPAPLTALIDEHERPTRPTRDGTEPRVEVTGEGGRRWALAGLARECEALRAMTRPDSGRNDQLNYAAFKMGRRIAAGWLVEAEVHDALVDAASGWSGHTAREIEATVRSGIGGGIRKGAPDGPAPRGQR